MFPQLPLPNHWQMLPGFLPVCVNQNPGQRTPFGRNSETLPLSPGRIAGWRQFPELLFPNANAAVLSRSSRQTG
jgi:hypothetical protein